jgi:hypothetical protein
MKPVAGWTVFSFHAATERQRSVASGRLYGQAGAEQAECDRQRLLAAIAEIQR